MSREKKITTAEPFKDKEKGTGGATTEEGEKEEAKGPWWSPSRNTQKLVTGIKRGGSKVKNKYDSTIESLRKIAIGIQKRGKNAKRKTVSTWGTIRTFRQHAMEIRAKEREDARQARLKKRRKREEGGKEEEEEEEEGRAEERLGVSTALWVLLCHEATKDYRKFVNRVKKEGSSLKQGFRQQKKKNIRRVRGWNNKLNNTWQKVKRLRYLRIQWRRPPPPPPEEEEAEQEGEKEGKEEAEGQPTAPEEETHAKPPPQQPPEKEGKGKEKVGEGEEEKRDKGKEGAGEKEGEGEGAEASEEPADVFFKKASMEAALDRLQTTEDGLTEDQVQERLKQYGENALPEHRTNPLLQFLLFYWNPLAWTMEIAYVPSTTNTLPFVFPPLSRSSLPSLPLPSLPSPLPSLSD